MTQIIGPLVEAARTQIAGDADVIAAFDGLPLRVLTQAPDFGERRTAPRAYVYFPVARRAPLPDRCAGRFQFELQAHVWHFKQEVLRVAAIAEAVEQRLARLEPPAGLAIGARDHALTHVEFGEDRGLMLGVVRYSYSVSIL